MNNINTVCYVQEFDAANTAAQSNLRRFDFERGATFRSNKRIFLKSLDTKVFYNNKVSSPNSIYNMNVNGFYLVPSIDQNSFFKSATPNYTGGTQTLSEFQNKFCFGNYLRKWTGFYELPDNFSVYLGVTPSFAATDIHWFNYILFEYIEL